MMSTNNFKNAFPVQWNTLDLKIYIKWKLFKLHPHPSLVHRGILSSEAFTVLRPKIQWWDSHLPNDQRPLLMMAKGKMNTLLLWRCCLQRGCSPHFVSLHGPCGCWELWLHKGVSSPNISCKSQSNLAKMFWWLVYFWFLVSISGFFSFLVKWIK